MEPMTPRYILGVLIVIGIYAIVIKTTDSGRCSRYEFFLKNLVIVILHLVSFIAIIIPLAFDDFRTSSIVFFLTVPLCIISFPYYLKNTIQRFYDLDLSGWYILSMLIPVVNIIVTLSLFFRKGKDEINAYDKAINYGKLFKDNHFIDMYQNKIIVNNEEYHIEKYLGKYIIKISKYKRTNFFTEYLQENFQAAEKDIFKIFEVTENDFKTMITDLDLHIIYESFYLMIKNFEVFIRKRDFLYQIILDKERNELSRELFETFDFPGSFSEDEKYVYYNKLSKEDLLSWIKGK